MISIIVPIYNVENYLEPCLESILNSTYRDFELILVDDGSPDNSGAICDSYADKDSRVRVIHQENAGVAAARNTGIRASNGDYVMFIDGDDLIHSRMIELLHDAIKSGDYDFSMIFGARVLEGDTSVIESMLNAEVNDASTYEMTQSDYINKLLSNGYERFWSLSVVNKLFKKTLVGDLFFDENINVAEDFDWSMRLSLLIKKAIVVDQKTYIYIQHRGSAMQSGVNEGMVKSIYLYKKNFDLLPVQYRSKALKLLYTYMLVIRRYSIHSKFKKETKAACADIYKHTISEFIRSDNSWSSKLRTLFGYHCPATYNYLLNKFEARAFKRKQGQALD